MLRAYTEDQLVEHPAIGLSAELGWTIAVGNPHPIPLAKGEGVWVHELTRDLLLSVQVAPASTTRTNLNRPVK